MITEEKTELPVSAQVEQSGAVSSAIISRGLVLLTEDNLANILMIGDYLEGKNFKVVVAHNGLEAVTLASEFNPNIILMDMQIPVMDGWEAVTLASEINPNIILMDMQIPVMDGLEATRRLRADPRFRSVPILALTALAMPGDRERCLEAGASEYLSKPVSLKHLVKMIYSLTGQSE